MGPTTKSRVPRLDLFLEGVPALEIIFLILVSYRHRDVPKTSFTKPTIAAALAGKRRSCIVSPCSICAGCGSSIRRRCEQEAAAWRIFLAFRRPLTPRHGGVDSIVLLLLRTILGQQSSRPW